jgi:hypothetical protein
LHLGISFFHKNSLAARWEFKISVYNEYSLQHRSGNYIPHGMVTPERRSLGAHLAETARHYWDLGLTSYGGPSVHVVILRRRFVDQLKWIDSTTFADLFSLGNALPGPGSTQLAFSIAVSRNGTLAGLLAFFFWA